MHTNDEQSAENGHDVTACLLAAGWVRDDTPARDLGECVAITGCSRAGRWVELHGYPYCAQHAHQGANAQRRHPSVAEVCDA